MTNLKIEKIVQKNNYNLSLDEKILLLKSQGDDKKSEELIKELLLDEMKQKHPYIGTLFLIEKYPEYFSKQEVKEHVKKEIGLLESEVWGTRTDFLFVIRMILENDFFQNNLPKTKVKDIVRRSLDSRLKKLEYYYKNPEHVHESKFKQFFEAYYGDPVVRKYLTKEQKRTLVKKNLEYVFKYSSIHEKESFYKENSKILSKKDVVTSFNNAKLRFKPSLVGVALLESEALSSCFTIKQKKKWVNDVFSDKLYWDSKDLYSEKFSERFLNHVKEYFSENYIRKTINEYINISILSSQSPSLEKRYSALKRLLDNKLTEKYVNRTKKVEELLQVGKIIIRGRRWKQTN
ncbi:hypothetical protein KY348_00845 [Candidatus Woesearchaeota archaeon]|nr:hypothetical protein [Candidatus Woesearchaeota archaeon]